MRKGDLVQLDPQKCFTTDEGGGLRYPLTNLLNDLDGTVAGRRPVTKEETEAWYASDASKGLDSAGESKLPPRSVWLTLHRDRVYHVVRARCRVSLGWGNPTPGMTELLCTTTGESAYVKRELLKVL